MQRRVGRQRGVALLVVLVMLVVVGLIAVTGAEDSQLQTKMSVNSRQYEEAVYNAENTLVLLETTLASNLEDGTWQVPESFEDGNVAGLYRPDPAAEVPVNHRSHDDMIDKGATLQPNGNAASSYVIEYLGKVGEAPLNPSNRASNSDLRPDAFRLTVLGRDDAGQGAWSLVQSEIILEPFF